MAVNGTVSNMDLDLKKASNFRAIHPSNFGESCRVLSLLNLKKKITKLFKATEIFYLPVSQR
jgi:hypothetical protein